MAKHVLSLEAPRTLNESILRVVDTSVYNSIVGVECPLLEITLPGFVYPVQIAEPDLTIGFMYNLTACDLEVQTEDCGTIYNKLPDGIYVIKYSVSPNEYVYVEYNHLRITHALNRLSGLLCDLEIPADCEPSAEVKRKWDILRDVREYLEAAVAKVETCHHPKEGMELYNYAIKLMDKYECKSC